MRSRLLKNAWTMAAFLPALAMAQDPGGPYRERSWEISLGAGMVFMDGALMDFLAAGPPGIRFANTADPGRALPTAVGRVGFNFTRNIGISAAAAGAIGSGVTYLTPEGALTYTVNLNARTSPFLIVGTHLTRITGDNDRVTHSKWGAHAGLGVRSMIRERLAVRLEGRVRIEGYDEVPMSKHTVYNPVATLGLSWFVGGRRPAPAVAAMPCPACPRAVARVDTVRVYIPFPAPPPAVIVLRDTLVLEGVNFAFDESVLTPESHRILDRVALALLEPQWANVRFEVAGHTSAIGTPEYNRSLSERRAEAVRAYLVSRGVPDGRMVARGYGETQPVFPNDREGRAWQNRRVELRRMR